jgi:hypothetical protein
MSTCACPQVIDWKRKIEILQMERNRTRQLLKSVTGMTVGGMTAGGSSSKLGTPHESIALRTSSSAVRL